MGRLTIPDSGRKKGTPVDLTESMRKAVDRELSQGYLTQLEASYEQERIPNYPLFPGGRLVRGVAREDVTRPLGDRAANDLWHAFEKVAGVKIMPGRGWYGARRTGADLAEDVERDGRALNAITGHTSDETRRSIYQEKLRNEVLGKAAVAREAARELAIEAAKANPEGEHSSTTLSAWERGREAKRLRRAAAHQKEKVGGERRRPTYAPRVCGQCRMEYVPTGANARACAVCSPRRKRSK